MGNVSTGKGTLRAELKRRKKLVTKQEHFQRERMWVGYLLALFAKDRGKIPGNIGNRMMIGNNIYVTKLYMSSITQITEFGLRTPTNLLGHLVDELRKGESDAVLDLTIMNERFDLKLEDGGLKTRIQMWEKSLDNELLRDKDKETAARCLYTVETARSGERLNKSRIFIKVRAKTGSKLNKAEKIVFDYLTKIGAVYLPIVSDIKDTLGYTSIVAKKRDKTVKDRKAVITSNKVLSQILPNCNSSNGSEGIYCGVNLQNNSEFRLDLSNVTLARDFYVVGQSGHGKTVLVANMAASAMEEGFAGCFMDIKGNDYTALVKSVDGYIVSTYLQSGEYINSYKMKAADSTDKDSAMYFKERIAFSKKQMSILSGIVDKEELNELDELLDEFLDTVYVSLGVLASNRNTWVATLELDPYRIYTRLVEYMTTTVRRRYKRIEKTVMSALKMYMSPTGSKSYIYRKEFDYKAILESRAISFDFGLLKGSVAEEDTTVFRLKFAFMQKLNAEFTQSKYSQGIKVFKVLEECQVVSDDVLRGYVEEFTLRRAQGQTTVLVGNSVAALVDNSISKALIENTTALMVGKLLPDAQEEVIKKFGLDGLEDVIRSVSSNKNYANSFVFVNRMIPEALVPILRVRLEKGKKYSMYMPSVSKE